MYEFFLMLKLFFVVDGEMLYCLIKSILMILIEKEVLVVDLSNVLLEVRV